MNILPQDPEIFGKVLEICRLVNDHGGKAYMVGGSVRDSLLGLTIRDFDLEIFNIPPSELLNLIKEHFSVNLVGKAFGVIKLNHYPIDLSLPRKEVKAGKKHNEFLISSDENMSPDQASRRRDFTINSILYDPIQEQILDPLNGTVDLDNKILRHCSDQFSEDPLRALRGMKFSSIFDLKPTEETRQLVSTIDLNPLSKSRIYEEWKQTMVRSTKPSTGMNYLDETNLIRFYPELAKMKGCPQDAVYHPEGDVWTHTLLCLDAFVKFRPNEQKEAAIAGLAVLCHDMGKPNTTVIHDTGRISSKRHEIFSEHEGRKFLDRITDNRSVIEAVLPLVKCHMIPYQLFVNNNPAASVRKLALKTGNIQLMSVVVASDRNGRGGEFMEHVPEAEYLINKARELEVLNSKPQPIIQGRHLIEFGYSPGRYFKEILNDCFDAQLNGDFFDLENGKKYLKSALNRVNSIQS